MQLPEKWQKQAQNNTSYKRLVDTGRLKLLRALEKQCMHINLIWLVGSIEVLDGYMLQRKRKETMYQI